MLANEDFENDTKDAGELGSGHSVTVCYELIPVDSDELPDGGNPFELSVRYKQPDGVKSILEEEAFGIDVLSDGSDDNFKFISAVIETSMILHESEYMGDTDLNNVLDTLNSIRLDDEYKEQFKLLIRGLINN